MSNKKKFVTGNLWCFVSLFFLLFSFNSNGQKSCEDAVEVSKELDIESFYKHLAFFANDSLLGRDVGTKGFNYAADYVVARLEEMNIEPAGEEDSYFQKVPFVVNSLLPDSVNFELLTKGAKTPLIFGKDFTVLPDFSKEKNDTTVDLVYVGFGIVNKALGIDDYQNVDLKGKIAVITLGLPKTMYHDSLQHYNNLSARISMAVKNGAKGVLFFLPGRTNSNLALNSLHSLINEPHYSLDNSYSLFSLLGLDSDYFIFCKNNVIKSIFEEEDLDFDDITEQAKEGKLVSKELKSQLRIKYIVESQRVNCKNIIGVLPGSDPKLKDEYVLVGAHLDHVGVGKAVKNDSIYNGAWDNASGSAAILTLAKAFSSQEFKPRRSLIFIWYTGEEKGLLGSEYFATHSTVPINKIVCAQNIDMIGGPYESADIIPMGYRYSNISEAVDFAVKELGLGLDLYSNFERQYFERSDHFSYIKQGVPGMFIWSGTKVANSKKSGENLYNKWEKKYYHKPSDEADLDFSREAFVNELRVNYLFAYFVANELEKVMWKTDNIYYKNYVLKK